MAAEIRKLQKNPAAQVANAELEMCVTPEGQAASPVTPNNIVKK